MEFLTIQKYGPKNHYGTVKRIFLVSVMILVFSFAVLYWAIYNSKTAMADKQIEKINQRLG